MIAQSSSLALMVGMIAALCVAPAHAAVTISTDATANMNCVSGVCTPTAADAVLNVGDLTTMLASGNVTVNTGTGTLAAPTSNMNCVSGVCTPTAADAVLNVGDLTTMLASGNATVNTGTGSLPQQVEDIIVAAPFNWASANALTLDAYRSVTVDQPVADNGSGAVTLTTNDGGSGGYLSFGSGGSLSFLGTSNSLTINSKAYALVDDIATLARAIAADPHGSYALAANYDASRDGTYTKSPIKRRLRGKFEGLGNEIQNLTITDPYYHGYVGLFAKLWRGGQISNIGIVNANVTSTSNESGGYVGTLVGFSVGVVRGSFASGAVSALNNEVGGLIGMIASGGELDHSHSSVSVSIAHFTGSIVVAGGLVGWNDGTISNSYATGAVSSADEQAEIAGLVSNNGGEISSSFATGNVSSAVAYTDWSGFVGYNFYEQNGYIGKVVNSYGTGSVVCDGTQSTAGGFANLNSNVIQQSYSTGYVEGAGSNGGFVAAEEVPASMESDYWDITTSKKKSGVGSGSTVGLKGLKTRKLQSGLPAGFDPTIWAESPSINNGFPYLIANPPR
jgi:hypothetical protein